MTTHISYKTAKALKAFMGESAPEPMCRSYYAKSHSNGWLIYDDGDYGTGSVFAYQLHDLLSRPFCEVFREKVLLKDSRKFNDVWTPRELGQILVMHYHDGGLPAVEAELMKMMGGK